MAIVKSPVAMKIVV